MRVVTWNIQKGIGLDFRRDLGRTVKVLEGLGADVIGLQEVLRTGEGDQAETVARELGMDLAWGRARAARGGEYGNALLVRGAAHFECVHELGIPWRENRVALQAVAEVSGVRVRMFVCHLGLGFGERRKQIATLTAHLRSAPKTEPRLVMGDFNEPHAGPVRRALAEEFPDAPAPLRTHPSMLPLMSLDRIAWDAPLRGDVRVVPVQGASDHRALLATLDCMPGLNCS